MSVGDRLRQMVLKGDSVSKLRLADWAHIASPIARSIYERDKALGTLMPSFVQWMDAALESWDLR